MTLEDTDIEEIIQIIEGRRDLTPSQYTVARNEWMNKILQDKDLAEELVEKFVNYRRTEVELKEFVLSVHKHDFD